MLGLPAPTSADPFRHGLEAARVLQAWIDHLRAADWPSLLAPTRARGRSLRNLTVNVFHPFELLPKAWTTGSFDWRPELDSVLEQDLNDRDALVRRAGSSLSGWCAFLDRSAGELEDRDPVVTSPRGEIGFSSLVAFQRWHAAYHYRQLVETLRPEQPLDLGGLAGLDLPLDVF